MLTSAGYLLLKAGTQFHGLIDAALGADDLTGRQFLVLTFAGGEDPLSQQKLSRRLGLDPTIVVGLIDELEGSGTGHPGPGSGRPPPPSPRVTAAGRRVQQRAAKAVATAEREFLAPLAAADRKELRRLLLDVMRSRLAWLNEA